MSYRKMFNDNVYHVYLNPDTNCIHVSCIGMNRLDTDVGGVYSSIEELPQWMQERLAVLLVVQPNIYYGDFGKSIDKNSFWVVQPR